MSYKAIAIWLALAMISSAQTDVARELKAIIDRREAAAAAALEPINRRHVEDLKGVLARATRQGDLDTAVKAREELAKYGVKTSPTGQTSGASPLEAFEIRIRGTVWAPVGENADKESRLTLAADGTTHANWHDLKQKWRVAGEGQLDIAYEKSGRTVRFTVDPDITTLKCPHATFKRVNR